jgi:hypothetical protein
MLLTPEQVEKVRHYYLTMLEMTAPQTEAPGYPKEELRDSYEYKDPRYYRVWRDAQGNPTDEMVYVDDGWNVTVGEGVIWFDTSMDNFDMKGFLRRLGVDPRAFQDFSTRSRKT